MGTSLYIVDSDNFFRSGLFQDIMELVSSENNVAFNADQRDFVISELERAASTLNDDLNDLSNMSAESNDIKHTEEVRLDVQEDVHIERVMPLFSEGCSGLNLALDIIAFVVGLAMIAVSLLVIALASDLSVYKMSGNSIFHIWGADVEEHHYQQSNSNAEKNYDIWTTKNAFFISVLCVPFLTAVYYASMSVARLEIVKLSMDVLNMTHKKNDKTVYSNVKRQYDIRLKFDAKEVSDDNVRKRWNKTEKEMGVDDSYMIESDRSGSDDSDVLDIKYNWRIFGCCGVGDEDRDVVVVNATGDVQVDVQALRSDIDDKKTESGIGCRILCYYFLAYVVTILSAWMVVKLASFQIYGTMTISDVGSAVQITNYEWVGWSDFYILFYHAIFIPIIFVISKKLTNDVIVDTLVYFCDDESIIK